MRVLNATALLLCGLLFLSCSPRGAVTPEMAFTSLRDAYNSSDSETFTAQLSRETIRKIQFILEKIKKMDRNQCDNFSSKLGSDCNTLKSLTPVDYVSLQLALDRKPGNTYFGIVLLSDITGKKTSPGRCILRTANGMEISFVKEGPYWKLDLKDF